MNKEQTNKLVDFLYKEFRIKELILIKVNKKTILVKFLDEINVEYTVTLDKIKTLED